MKSKLKALAADILYYLRFFGDAFLMARLLRRERETTENIFHTIFKRNNAPDEIRVPPPKVMRCDVPRTRPDVGEL